MVAHASTRATQLYDRRPDEMSLDRLRARSFNNRSRNHGDKQAT
jgi:hypothetical protein